MSITLYPAVDNDGNTTVWSPDSNVGHIVAVLNTSLDLESAAHLAVLMAASANLIQRLAAELDMEPAELARRIEDDQFDARLDVVRSE